MRFFWLHKCFKIHKKWWKLSQRTKRTRSPKPVFTTDLIFGVDPKTLQKENTFPHRLCPTNHGGVSVYEKTPLLLVCIALGREVWIEIISCLDLNISIWLSYITHLRGGNFLLFILRLILLEMKVDDDYSVWMSKQTELFFFRN